MSTTTRGKNDTTGVARPRSHGEETKPSSKTSAFAVYVLGVIGVLIAWYVVGDRAANGGSDIFADDEAWWSITLLTIGYLGTAEDRAARRGVRMVGHRYRLSRGSGRG